MSLLQDGHDRSGRLDIPHLLSSTRERLILIAAVYNEDRNKRISSSLTTAVEKQDGARWEDQRAREKGKGEGATR